MLPSAIVSRPNACAARRDDAAHAASGLAPARASGECRDTTRAPRASSNPATGAAEAPALGGSLVRRRGPVVFEPGDDPYAPALLIEALQRESPRRFPAERLMMAVLEDAIRCYVKHARARAWEGRRSFVTAREWLLERDRGGLFSFESICDALDLEPERIRAGLSAWKRARGA